MEVPGSQLPPRGQQRPQAPWPLQPLVLAENACPAAGGLAGNFRPAGLPNPRPEQPFQAPPVVMAPGAPRAPPPGLQMAPCGCFFDPRVFHIEWTTTSLPSPATFTLVSSAPLPGAAPRGPQSCRPPPAWVPPPRIFTPYAPQGRVVAPAPSVLPPSLPSFQHMDGQLWQVKLPSAAVPVGAPMGGGIPLGSEVPVGSGTTLSGGTPGGSDAPQGNSIIPDIQARGDAPESPDISVPEEVLLEEAMRLFDCSQGAGGSGGSSQDTPSSVPTPADPSDANSSNPHYDINSLSLPEEILSSDYSVTEAPEAIPSMDLLLDEILMNAEEILMKPDELQWDLPPQDDTSQPNTKPEKRGKKRRKSSLPEKGSKRKRKASAASHGAGGQH